MKIAKSKLKQIIREELRALNEDSDGIPSASESLDNEVFSLKRAISQSKRVEDAKRQLVKSTRREIQRSLMMDEARPGEDKWLEEALKQALERGEELDSVLRAYLQNWRSR